MKEHYVLHGAVIFRGARFSTIALQDSDTEWIWHNGEHSVRLKIEAEVYLWLYVQEIEGNTSSRTKKK